MSKQFVVSDRTREDHGHAHGAAGAKDKDKASVSRKPPKRTNAVRKIRENLLMSKAELARKAGVSVLTVSRIENGIACRMDTKRKIILALGYTLVDREKVFPES